MAQKRMFSMRIVDTDSFLDMPLSSQCLYFHFNMRADDDGFIDNPKRIMRVIGASEDDLKVLLAKKFLLAFESGVIVVKHWRMHNTLSAGRYTPTQYLDEKSNLLLKDNGSYSFTSGSAIDDSKQIATGRRQVRRTLDEHKTIADKDIDKDIDKDKDLDKEKDKDKSTSAPLLYFPADADLDSTFADYVAMRKTIKKPMTQKAISLAIEKLNNLSNSNAETAKKILEQSILNSWQGLFPLKIDGKNDNERNIERWRDL